jgi:hypothetical protein
MPPKEIAMHRTVSTIQALHQHWDSRINFLMSGECVPFNFEFPALEQIIDVVRRDDEAKVVTGERDHRQNITEDFRRRPLEAALDSCFHLSHFNLSRFCGPGQILHGFEERVMEPWRMFLRRAGFTWERCYPILFIAGPNSGTAYHVDNSNVIAWQLYGTKVFSGLRNPDHFAPIDWIVRRENQKSPSMPAHLTDADILAYTMQPGSVLWNHLLTPHWVDATDRPAVSVNISHGMLRLNGRLGRNEQTLADWWNAHPDESWQSRAK